MNITINTDVFAAASLFRGIDDIRYYLNGLLLETGANGARLVGCDGHQLCASHYDAKVLIMILPKVGERKYEIRF